MSYPKGKGATPNSRLGPQASSPLQGLEMESKAGCTWSTLKPQINDPRCIISQSSATLTRVTVKSGATGMSIWLMVSYLELTRTPKYMDMFVDLASFRSPSGSSRKRVTKEQVGFAKSVAFEWGLLKSEGHGAFIFTVVVTIAENYLCCLHAEVIEVMFRALSDRRCGKGSVGVRVPQCFVREDWIMRDVVSEGPGVIHI